MRLKLAGYELAPKGRFQKDLMGYTQRLARGDALGQPPAPATPVYADEAGNHFIALPGEDGVAALPFIPGSPAQGDLGGFVPLAEMPAGGGGDGTSAMMGGMAQAVPAQKTGDWLGQAATNAMLAGAPGTAAAAAMGILGMGNPGMSGALGGALAAAAGAAGLGPVGSLLGGAIGGGGQGLMNAIGAQGLNSLLGATGLGRIPGAGAAASILGGQLSNLADMMTEGAWSAAMDKATGAINDLMSGKLPEMGSLGDFVDPNAGAGSLGDIDVGAIGAQALDQAAGQLLSQWQVDDDSSAAEQIAHKAVTDNQGAIKEAVTDPSGFQAKIKGMFSGVSSGAVLPAARITDMDFTKPDVVAQGVATILAEGLPISRMSDPLAPSGSLILQGSATVLSAGLPTARVTSQTAPPDVLLVKGAPTVLVGGPTATISPPAPPPPPKTSSNGGPAGPDAPSKPASGSGGGKSGGSGSGASGEVGDSNKAGSDTQPSKPPSEPTSQPTAEDNPLDGAQPSATPAPTPTPEDSSSSTPATELPEPQPQPLPAPTPADSTANDEKPPCEGELVIFNERSHFPEGSPERTRDLDQMRAQNEAFAKGRGADFTTADSTAPIDGDYCKVTVAGHATDEDGPITSPELSGIIDQAKSRGLDMDPVQSLEIASCGGAGEEKPVFKPDRFNSQNRNDPPYNSDKLSEQACQTYGIPVSAYTSGSYTCPDGGVGRDPTWLESQFGSKLPCDYEAPAVTASPPDCKAR